MRVEPFDTQRQMIFSRRAAIFGGGAILAVIGLEARLYHLQVRNYAGYRDLAEDNRLNQQLIVPLRGDILDRFGLPIASNRQSFRVLMVPEKSMGGDSILSVIEKIIPLSESQKQRVMREIRQKRAFTPIIVKDDLTWDEFASVNFHASQMPGVILKVGDTRSYPWRDASSMITGFVGTPSEDDLDIIEDTGQEILFRQPSFRVGRAGLEKTFDAQLRGKPGSKTVIVNAHGKVINEEINTDDTPEQGMPFGLTIDAELQHETVRILREDHGALASGEAREPESAAAVVMDVTTGDILVLASTPSFDPNDFINGISAQKWKGLNESKFKPLLNKPVSGVYPPGSTFKLLTAIAAQEAGMSPHKRTYCAGRIWYGNRYFNCWKGGGHGALDMEGAIKHSCDVYFWDIARRLDIDLLADVAKRYGLGRVFDLGIGSQKKGVVPDRAWKKEYFRSNPPQQAWFPGETLSVAIGQGYVTSTPLQLAVMTARIATGKDVTPRLIRMIDDRIIPVEKFRNLPGNPGHLAVVRNGMDAVVNKRGTAARSALLKEQWRMAGKTGTSQITSLQLHPVTGRRLKAHELSWDQRDHALFVCYAPFDAPRYACAVVVEHGGSGSRAAGPRARDIMNAVFRKDPLGQKAFDPATGKAVKLPELLRQLGQRT